MYVFCVRIEKKKIELQIVIFNTKHYIQSFADER